MKTPTRNFTSVDDYIASFPPDVRGKLETLRKTIRKAAPKAEELISYGIAGYKQDGPVAYIAGYKEHIGYYPRPGGFEKQLAKYKGGKGTIQFPIDEPIPVKLVTDMVKHQVAKNKEKKSAKSKK